MKYKYSESILIVNQYYQGEIDNKKPPKLYILWQSVSSSFVFECFETLVL